MADDKCYICLDTEGILNKTCTNKKCNARTHSLCLRDQYVTSNKNLTHKCGVCQFNIRRVKQFNSKRFLSFLFTTCIYALDFYLIFTTIMGLNPLNPFDPNFNDIKIITVNDIHSITYMVIILLTYINFVVYMSSFLFREDVLLNELNNKHGEFRFITEISVLEIMFILTCHVIGYYSLIIFDNNTSFYTYKTFLAGLGSILFTLFILFLSYLIHLTCKYILPCCLPWLLEPFYDEQFGE